MSYRTWVEYGYGITDEFSTTKEAVLKLLELAPKTKELVDPQENDTLEQILEFEDEYGLCGILAILQSVIEEVDDIRLTLVEDYDGVQYLLYTPSYPWWTPEREKVFKEEDIDNLINNYMPILTGKEAKCTYLECENGG